MTVVLVGNPRPSSRTRVVAETVAARVSARLGLSSPVTTVELADLAPQLFAASRPDVDAALATVADARLLVVATPVYKASYTGLLKSFLDLYGPAGLAGVDAIPVVVSASPGHASAGDRYLLPLLVELGARVPRRALAVLESQLGDVERIVDEWDGAPLVPAASVVR
jgi:FMN reductase